MKKRKNDTQPQINVPKGYSVEDLLDLDDSGYDFEEAILCYVSELEALRLEDEQLEKPKLPKRSLEELFQELSSYPEFIELMSKYNKQNRIT